MKTRMFVVAVLLLGIAIAVAGCTSSGTQSSGTTVSSGTTAASGTAASSGSGTTATLTTQPTDVMPDNVAVTVTVGEKDYLGKIPVTFNGGKGQTTVKTITCTLTRADGTTQTMTLGSNKGDSISLDGTRGTGSLEGEADRVQVTVLMMTGNSYKVADVLREYRSRG